MVTEEIAVRFIIPLSGPALDYEPLSIARASLGRSFRPIRLHHPSSKRLAVVRTWSWKFIDQSEHTLRSPATLLAVSCTIPSWTPIPSPTEVAGAKPLPV